MLRVAVAHHGAVRGSPILLGNLERVTILDPKVLLLKPWVGAGCTSGYYWYRVPPISPLARPWYYLELLALEGVVLGYASYIPLD